MPGLRAGAGAWSQVRPVSGRARGRLWRLVGHNRTATTELVYRHELRPVITTGAEEMDRILNLRG